jgi:ATP-dependent Clp protease protease subunit
MIHQPSGGAEGKASDIEIQVKELLELKKRLNKIYANCTGQKLSVVEEAMDRDRFMSATEAKDFGLIDNVIVHREENAHS